VNDDNPKYDPLGGNNTQDLGFSVSVLEAEWYFKNDYEIWCQPMEHGCNQRTFVDNSDGYCWW
jgi:hypothetical protein